MQPAAPSPAPARCTNRDQPGRIATDRLRRKILCGLLATACAPIHSPAATLPGVQLTWDRNPEPDIAGYEVRYGTTPGVYPNSLATGKATKASISGLSAGTTYYFVVAAYNNAGFFSPESAMVSHRMDAAQSDPPAGIINAPASDLTIATGGSVSFSGSGTDPGNLIPLTYLWNFGTGSGIANSRAGNPGTIQFNQPGTHTVTFTVTNSLGLADPTPATRTITVKDPVSAYPAIPRGKWTIHYVNSQETSRYEATSAFDGNPGTFWQTRATTTRSSRKSNEIQIDMGTLHPVSAFRYLPRQDGVNTGNIGKYRFYVSRNGVNWGKPVATGSFANSKLQKQVSFKTKRGRYLRLVSLADVNGSTICNVAELQVLRRVKAKSTAKSTATGSRSLASAILENGAKTSSSPPPGIATEVIDGKKYLSLTYTKPSSPNAGKPTIEVSPDLLNWSSGRQHTTVLIDNDHILKVRDNTPITRNKKRFIRLKPLPR